MEECVLNGRWDTSSTNLSHVDTGTSNEESGLELFDDLSEAKSTFES